MKCELKPKLDIMPHRLQREKLNRMTTPNLSEDVEELKLLYCWWESQKGQILWKAVWQFLMNKYLPYDLQIPFLDIYPRE